MMMPIATSWIAVFHLAISETGTTRFVPARNSRKPAIRNSRIKINKAGTKNKLPSVRVAAKARMVPATSNLSAMGSSMRPNGDTLFICRASQPSSQSEAAATIKRIKVARVSAKLGSCHNKTATIGADNTRNNVMIFGKSRSISICPPTEIMCSSIM